jgi:hypothetical protein
MCATLPCVFTPYSGRVAHTGYLGSDRPARSSEGSRVRPTFAMVRRRWADRAHAPPVGRRDWQAAVAQYDQLAAALAATRALGYAPPSGAPRTSADNEPSEA